MAAEGYKVTYVGVDKEGLVDANDLKKAIRPETILISVMYANNEIGTVQPVAEIGRLTARINAERVQRGLTRIVLHSDACQAAGFLDLNVHKLGLDLLSVNGSKIYGPKQSGFLYIKNDVQLTPLIYGGGQEKDLRSGTQNVAGAVGLAEALRLAQKNQLTENKRLSKLRHYCIEKLFKTIPKITLNGSIDQRLPNNINVTIEGVEGESLMLYLDSYNIAVSTGSACSSATNDPSHVLLALGRTPRQAQSSIRLTLGRGQTKSRLTTY